ncbi:MerR family DNA-binding protein [Massilia sp. B-10]|nr:MerR family DNA-binding protein [Massilia sp. B-10]
MPTIRYCEQIGLLPRPSAQQTATATIGNTTWKRLTFIKRCRDFGFPIERVRDLAGLFEDGDRACAEVRDLAQAHLEETRAKLEEMRQLEISLEAFVGRCAAACIGGPARSCVIMDDMAPPGCGTRTSVTISGQVGAPVREGVNNFV